MLTLEIPAEHASSPKKAPAPVPPLSVVRLTVVLLVTFVGTLLAFWVWTSIGPRHWFDETG